MKAAELVVACFLLFGTCLVWPLLAIANRPVLVAGVPVSPDPRAIAVAVDRAGTGRVIASPAAMRHGRKVPNVR